VEHITTIEGWRTYASAQRALGRRVGLVPTMGALHEGHTSLFHAAAANADVVVATIFVNPRQFNDPDDLRAYPRTPERDHATAETNGVDCLIEPSLDEMWPDSPNTATTVSVRGLGETLEGADRPGHFDGVASVVAKLLTITGPCRVYFGEKDFQQLAVIRQMVRDLGFDAQVVGCPIVRDERGLALSSRNVLLSDAGRSRALALVRALGAAAASPASASEVRARLRAALDEADVAVAYAEVVDPLTLAPSRDGESGEGRALVAGIIEGVRLIDNGPVTLTSGGPCC